MCTLKKTYLADIYNKIFQNERIYSLLNINLQLNNQNQIANQIYKVAI